MGESNLGIKCTVTWVRDAQAGSQEEFFLALWVSHSFPGEAGLFLQDNISPPNSNMSGLLQLC